MEQFGALEIVQIGLAGIYCVLLWLYMAKSM